MQICEDLWDDNYICKVTEKQFKLGAECFINISASPFHSNQFQDRKSLIERKIKKFKKPFFYCNTVGAQDELIFDGQSMAFSNKGVAQKLPLITASPSSQTVPLILVQLRSGERYE